MFLWDFELNRPRSAQGDPESRVDSEEFDVLDDDYHETMGLYQKASLKDSEVKGELAYITDLRNKLRESDVPQYMYNDVIWKLYWY